MRVANINAPYYKIITGLLWAEIYHHMVNISVKLVTICSSACDITVVTAVDFMHIKSFNVRAHPSNKRCFVWVPISADIRSCSHANESVNISLVISHLKMH